MREIVLSEHDIKVLINKGKVRVMLEGEEILVRESYRKDLRAEVIKWDKEIVDVSQDIVRNMPFNSLFQGAAR
ncbi:TPA: hypothetical protein U2D46_000483 [Streptococcus suis]|uniref:hypothetical protein n=1 Tax=Streptococcus suis TaxID=1307 RepID=UPI000492AD23|nr:hypothetical protein [Streptococcus suis]ASW52604.1 hypothetical protein A7J09_11085 [Streptococcus suis]KPA70628.1 hypothetical protein XK26_00495 [Streptococcus suis]MBS8079072.1 hypothetical protein [Streptococcus suis]MCK3890723.1 hypothetical protein [Streptococcus suis]MCK3965342.1 hypothetical protein [Streptococcus suis]